MEFFITDFDSSIDISVFDSDLFSPNGNRGNHKPCPLLINYPNRFLGLFQNESEAIKGGGARTLAETRPIGWCPSGRAGIEDSV